MSKPSKPNNKISADQVSGVQREIAELLNPEIELNRKQAIARSPKVNAEEQLDMRNLPDHLLTDVEKAGLLKELSLIPRCKITLPKKGNPVTHLLGFISKYGKVNKFAYMLIALFLIVTSVHSQSLSAGIGITSSGRTSVMLTAECAKHLLYLKSIKQGIVISESYPGEIEQHETIIGYGYKPDDRVTLLIGAGWCKDYITYINDLDRLYIMPGLQMNSFEGGFRYDLFKYERFDLTLTALMSTYSGLSTMAGIKWKFESCR